MIALDLTATTPSDYNAPGAAEIETHTVDLTDASAVADAVKSIVARHPDTAALVNVAGAVRSGTAIDTDDENWLWNLHTNASSTFYVCRSVLPHLVQRGGGSIVNFSSLTAVKPMLERAGYAAAKGAVLALTRQLAYEYGPHGVRVNTIIPGAIRTPLLQQRLVADPSVEHELTERVPLRRLGEAEELAALVKFLVSDSCAYLTGQAIAVDGGLGLA